MKLTYALGILAALALVPYAARADDLSPAAQQSLNTAVAAQIGELALDNATLRAQLSDEQRVIADLQKQLLAAKAAPGSAVSPNPDAK